jgi:hAT family protein
VPWNPNYLPLSLMSVKKIEEEMTTELFRVDAFDDNSQNLTPQPPKKKKTDALFSIFDEMPNRGQENTVSILSDYYKYVMEPNEPPECDPLQFWKKEGAKFRSLQIVARMVLGIPASTGSVERLFSIAGAIGNARRSNLAITAVEHLIMRRERQKEMSSANQ